MTPFNIDMPPALQHWIESRIAAGLFVDAGDYLRHLVRRDQDRTKEDDFWVREIVEEGLASGVIEQDARQVLRDIITERTADD